MGKTAWARSLGSHSYFNTLFNLADFTPSADYAVFDDINPEFFPNYKGWLGGQHTFSVSGKYMRNRTIRWGKPAIWVSNVDPRGTGKWDNNWLEINCIFVDIFTNLF